MTKKVFQDYYPDYFSHCYGCGRLNEYGLQIKVTGMERKPSASMNPRITTRPSPATFTAASWPGRIPGKNRS